MFCSTCRKQQILYERGELAAGRRAAVARHLERCPRCREAYREGERLRALLRPAPEVGSHHALWAGVAARIPDEQSTGRQPRPRPVLQRAWRPAAALAAVAVAAALTFSLLGHPGGQAPAGAWVERAVPPEISRQVRDDPWAGDMTRALDSTLSAQETTTPDDPRA
jgi:anti-sigma factor RsiW